VDSGDLRLVLSAEIGFGVTTKMAADHLGEARSIALRIAQLPSGTGLSQTENVDRDGEWQSP
jgi:hypothetical protein